MPSSRYEESVFVNCPFGPEYDEFLRAIVFAIHDCGFVARCAKEENDSGTVRTEKIIRLIKECQFGIHDISCTALCKQNNLPRFNMPFELGLFLGASHYGTGKQKNKQALIVDSAQYRYQKFLSDISGQDIFAHKRSQYKLIALIRDWFGKSPSGKIIPGGDTLIKRYRKFRRQLPAICDAATVRIDEITYLDFLTFATSWQKNNEDF